MSSRYKHIVFVFFGVILFICMTQDIYAARDIFDVYELHIGGDQIDYLVEDLNNDGLNDILFFHTSKKGRVISRYFSLFYQTLNGFNTHADQSFEVDPEAVIYDLANVDGKPGKEILFFKDKGILYYGKDNGSYYPKPRVLVKTNSIYSLPDKKFLEHLDFARDLNGDGIDEILIPQFKACLIYGKWRPQDHMQTPNWDDPFYALSSAPEVDLEGYTLKSTLDVLLQNSIISSKEVSRYLVSSFVTPNIVIDDSQVD